MHVDQLVSNILPIPQQLDPSLDSYYSNTSGLFRGDLRYYNLSSIPYDTNVTWKPIAERIMENANLSAIPERLGNRNWSAVDTIRIRVHDVMTSVANVSESIAIFQVLYSLLPLVWRIPKIAFRENSNFLTLQLLTPYSWSLMVYISQKMALSTRWLTRKGMSHVVAARNDLFELSQCLVRRRAGHSKCCSHRRTEHYRFNSTGRDDPSLVKTKNHDRLERNV